MVNNKLVDIAGLQRYHENLKTVLNAKETAGSAAAALEDAKAYADGLASNYDAAGSAAAAETAAKAYADEEIAKLSFDEAGSAAEAYAAAKDYVDGLVKNEDGSVKFDASGSAATAEQNAKDYADGLAANYDAAGTAAGLNAAMDERVVKLEAIDHDKIVADAIAAVVDGAESDFDTLKEVADWIRNDTTGAAALQVAVSEHGEAIADLTNNKQDVIDDLDAIRSGAASGATAEQNAKDYATGLVMDGENVRFDAAGSAAAAETAAKAYADGLATNYDAAGSAATAEQNAKDYADGLSTEMGNNVDTKQDIIDDLDAIRSGAASGATALQASDLQFATDDDIDGLFA